MAKMATFFKLKLRHKGLLLLSFIFLGIARLMINTLPFRVVSRFFGPPVARLIPFSIMTSHQEKKVIVLNRLIKLAAKYTPWNSNCLTQALVARTYCALFNIPYILYIGVERESAENGLSLHAWVMSGSMSMTGGNCASSHKVLLSYSNR